MSYFFGANEKTMEIQNIAKKNLLIYSIYSKRQNKLQNNETKNA